MTERPGEHLVWHQGRILIRNLRDFRFVIAPGRTTSAEMSDFTAAMGTLLSYLWLGSAEAI